MVRAEPLERRVKGVEERVTRGVDHSALGRAADPCLGDDLHVGARDGLAEQRAEQRLRAAVRVRGGGVDERSACVEEQVELFAGLFLVCVAAPRHGAERELRDLESCGPNPAHVHARDATQWSCVLGARRAGTNLALMSWWEAAILGLVQGLTEFLPISSSAHIRVIGELLPNGCRSRRGVHRHHPDRHRAGRAAVLPARHRADHFAAWWRALVGRDGSDARARFGAHSADARLAWFIALGTFPWSCLACC